MAELQVQQLDARLFDALGILSRQGFRPMLQEGVSIVVSVPLNIGSANALGFNDAETDAQAAFAGWLTSPADAVNLSAAQLLNPTGSGDVVYVDEVAYMVGNAADNVQLAFFNTALATLVGTPILKYAGAAGTVTTQLRRSNPAAALSASSFRLARAAVVNTEYPILFNPPLRLDAGFGVAIWTETVNRALTLSVSGRKYAAA